MSFSFQIGVERATYLYEWALTEAIIACMRFNFHGGSQSQDANLSKSSQGLVTTAVTDAAAGRNETTLQIASMKTGIHAWDSSLLDEACHVARKQREHKKAGTATKDAEDLKLHPETNGQGSSAAGGQHKPGNDDTGVDARSSGTTMPTSLMNNAGARSYGNIAARLRRRPQIQQRASRGRSEDSYSRYLHGNANTAGGHPRIHADAGLTDDCGGQDDKAAMSTKDSSEQDCEQSGRLSSPTTHVVAEESVTSTSKDDPALQELQQNTRQQDQQPCRECLTKSQGRLGDVGLEKALDLATRCLQEDESHAKAYALRAEMEGLLGKRERAIADFEAAAMLDVGDPRPRINQVHHTLRQSTFSDEWNNRTKSYDVPACVFYTLVTTRETGLNKMLVHNTKVQGMHGVSCKLSTYDHCSSSKTNV